MENLPWLTAANRRYFQSPTCVLELSFRGRGHSTTVVESTSEGKETSLEISYLGIYISKRSRQDVNGQFQPSSLLV